MPLLGLILNRYQGNRILLHFLNVSRGDCTFIEPPSGRPIMVDINNSKGMPQWSPEAPRESYLFCQMSRGACVLGLRG